MSSLVAKGFNGLGLNLNDLYIANRRPDGKYLDEELSNGIYTCICGEGCLYFGITPRFPWESGYQDVPQDEAVAKRQIAMKLLEYLTEERSRLEKDTEEYEESLDEELPAVDDVIANVCHIEESWVERW